MTKEAYIDQISTHKAMMYRIAFTILQNDSDVQDALQETALKAWEKQHTLRNEAFFASWMTRILINESYTIRRKRLATPLIQRIQTAAGNACTGRREAPCAEASKPLAGEPCDFSPLPAEAAGGSNKPS